jgi:hypothetical protein
VLGHEDLNDHDELRHDPVVAVLADKRRLHALLALTNLERTQILPLGRIGRAAEEDCEVLNVTSVVALVFSPKPRTVMSSIMRRRSGLMDVVVCIGVLLVSRWSCSTPRPSRPGASHPVTALRCSHHSPAICQTDVLACHRLARSAFVP